MVFLFVYVCIGLLMALRVTVSSIEGSHPIFLFLERFQWMKFIYLPFLWLPILTYLIYKRRVTI